MTPSRQTIIWMMMPSHFVNLLVLSEKRKDCSIEIKIESIGNIVFHHPTRINRLERSPDLSGIYRGKKDFSSRKHEGSKTRKKYLIFVLYLFRVFVIDFIFCHKKHKIHN